MGFNMNERESAPPGRFTLSSYILNIRPQIDLNLFMSIFNSFERKDLPAYGRAKVITRRDIIFWIPGNPP